MIEALWAIVLAFVDLGWGIRATETCGQSLDLATTLRLAVLDSKDQLTDIPPDTSQAVGQINKPSSSEAVGQMKKPSSSEAIGHQSKEEV